MKTWTVNYFCPAAGEITEATVQAHSVIFEPENSTARFMVKDNGETVVFAVYTQVSTLQLT